MSLYRRKNSPYWQFDFEIHGYRFSGSTRLTDKRDATALEESEKLNARELVDRLIGSGRKPMTIEQACTRWWNEHGRDLNDPSVKAKLDWLVAQLGPSTPLHAIDNDTVSRLVQARRLDVRRSGFDERGRQLYRPITNTTVNKTTVVLLRRVMRYARDSWDVSLLREPVWKKHLLKQTKRQVRELMPSEEATLDAIEHSDFAEVRRLAIITGLRRGNVLLKKSQVNFEAGTIAVITKGGTPRILPLSAEAYAILWRRRHDHPQVFFTFKAQRTRKCPQTGKLFVRGERYPITYYGLGTNKRRRWEAAGVIARIHDLRHTTGMRTLRATGNLKTVQVLLGHTDIKITAEFYTDATLEDLRAAMETTSAATPPALPAPTPKKQEGNE